MKEPILIGVLVFIIITSCFFVNKKSKLEERAENKVEAKLKREKKQKHICKCVTREFFNWNEVNCDCKPVDEYRINLNEE